MIKVLVVFCVGLLLIEAVVNALEITVYTQKQRTLIVQYTRLTNVTLSAASGRRPLMRVVPRVSGDDLGTNTGFTVSLEYLKAFNASANLLED